MTRLENSASTQLTKYQFRLRYLIYLMTVLAVGFAVLRYLFDISPGHQFIWVMSAYVALLVVYFAFRFPILIRRMMRSREKLKSKRTELIELADQVRSRKPSDS